MSEKIAFLTVVFPMEENYLTDFFSSLSAQTFKNFDLVVVNDQLQNLDKMIAQFADLKITVLNFSDTPLKNRQHGIEFILANNYDIVIFGDSDDYFSSNRVEVSIEKLAKYDVVVNDLSAFNDSGVYQKKYFSNRLQNDTEISIEYIKDKNIFGMSNTALRVRSIGNIIYDSDLIAFDWYIFSLALLKSGVGLFTNECETFYRQHRGNTVGIGKLDRKLFIKGLAVKKKQYELLSKEDKRFESFLNEIDILSLLVLDEDLLDTIIASDIKYPFWWEQIKLIEEYK